MEKQITPTTANPATPNPTNDAAGKPAGSPQPTPQPAPQVAQAGTPAAPAGEGKPTAPETDAAAAPKAAPFLVIRHNHRPKELTEEEARALAQKGLNYEKESERAKRAGADEWIKAQGWTFQGKPITSVAEYQRVMAIKQLMDKGVSYEEARAAIDNSPEVQEAKRIIEENQKAEAEKAREADLQDFVEWYEAENGKPFDQKAETIPKEVWELQAAGVPLRVAYQAIVENKRLRERIEQMEKDAEKAQANKANAETAVGSAAGDGSAPQDKPFFTRDEVKAMSREEAAKNHEKIRESMKFWK